MPRDLRLSQLAGPRATVNEEIMDRAIRHAVFLERLKSGEVRKIVSFLNDEVLQDVIDRLRRRLSRAASRGFTVTTSSTQWLRDMMTAISGQLREGFALTRNILRDDLIELATSEAQFTSRVIAGAAPVELDLTSPNLSVLRQVVTSRPFGGKVLGRWFSTLNGGTLENLRREVGVGLSLGESTDQITRRVAGTQAAGFADGVVGSTMRRTEALVRTAVTHVTTQAREAVFEENSDLVEGERYTATLDLRTSAICRALDGKVFPVGKGPRPPMHPN